MQYIDPLLLEEALLFHDTLPFISTAASNMAARRRHHHVYQSMRNTEPFKHGANSLVQRNYSVQRLLYLLVISN